MSSAVVVGLGATGSVTVSLLARWSRIVRLVLVDYDRYEAANLGSQNLLAADVGQAKAEAQAARVRAINPELEVIALVDDVDNLPLGLLRCDVILCCVDSRRARQAVNRIACRLGKPLLDVAVGAPSLARMSVWRPNQTSACIECNWPQEIYDRLDQRHPCNPAASSVPATAAPAELGSLAASIQCSALRNLWDSDAAETLPSGTQLMIDTATWRLHRVSFRRNPRCRFDHQAWTISPLPVAPRARTLADLFAALPDFAEPVIAVEGHVFASRLDCAACGNSEPVGLAMVRRLGRARRTCACGAERFAAGHHGVESLSRAALAPAQLGLALDSLGLRDGDVITVRDRSGTPRHFELGGIRHHAR